MDAGVKSDVKVEDVLVEETADLLVRHFAIQSGETVPILTLQGLVKLVLGSRALHRPCTGLEAWRGVVEVADVREHLIWCLRIGIQLLSD